MYLLYCYYALIDLIVILTNKLPNCQTINIKKSNIGGSNVGGSNVGGLIVGGSIVGGSIVEGSNSGAQLSLTQLYE